MQKSRKDHGIVSNIMKQNHDKSHNENHNVQAEIEHVFNDVSSPKNKTDPEEYWFNHRIHTLGNTGFFGALHSAMVPVSTKLIDMLAYKGLNVRNQVAGELRQLVGNKNDARVLDVCCGVGISTRALKEEFHGPDNVVVGLDTSPEMVEMAQMITVHDADLNMVLGRSNGNNNNKGLLRLNNKSAIEYFVEKLHRQLRGTRVNAASRIANECSSTIRFVVGNAEKTTFPDESFDLVTIMYALHEVPYEGRERIFHEARRLLKKPSNPNCGGSGGTLAIVDISRDYSPSKSMLAGEPYVIEYQKNIHEQLLSLSGFDNDTFQNKIIVPGHVEMWTLTRK